MRIALAGVTAAALLATPLAAPASAAAAALVLNCTLTYASYGTGWTTGTGTCTTDGGLGTATLTFQATIAPSTCPLLETGVGELNGAVRTQIAWDRDA